MNFRSAFEKVNDEVRNFSPDDILHALGLEKKRSATEKMLPMIGIFGAGLLVGAGIAMLLTPKSGREIREAIGGTVTRYTSREGTEGGEAKPGYGATATASGASAPNGRVNI